MDQIEKFIALSDPGEVGRAEHNRGDRLIIQIGNVFAWLFPILMMAIVIQVFLRNFGRVDIGPGNQAWLDDLQWWLYGAAVIIGIAYAVTTNAHVRVDIFYENFKREKQTRIEIVALAWLFLPFIILCWDTTFHYAWSSVVANEGSDSPNGLHNLWILKVFMNVTFVIIGIAIWSAYVRYLSRLTQPTLFKQLLIAFPSTMFMVNLIVFYVIYWYLYLGLEEGANPRTISRNPIFDEFEILGQDIKYTIIITFITTLVVLGAAWLYCRRRQEA
jgi:TRAP-type mannitol/chloroaromatic compound transport system permease small subunit